MPFLTNHLSWFSSHKNRQRPSPLHQWADGTSLSEVSGARCKTFAKGKLLLRVWFRRILLCNAIWVLLTDIIKVWLSGNKYCHEFRFSIVGIAVSVSIGTSLQDCLVSQLWANIAAHNCERTNHADLWQFRHWLQFWQLRTWIHDNLCYLTIKSDSGKHSQFLRCLESDLIFVTDANVSVKSSNLFRLWNVPV